MGQTYTIRVRRGLKADLPTQGLAGEMFFCRDTGEMFVGQGAGLPLIGCTGPQGEQGLQGDPGVSNLTVQVDDVDAGSQTVLDLKAGDNITLIDDGSGGITISSTASGSGGSSIPITGTLTHAGMIPISQPGNTSAVWSDPLVQGLQAEGTSASTVAPVLIGGKDGSGNLKDLVLDASGRPTVNVNGTVTVAFGSAQHIIVDSATLGTVAVSGTFWQATQPISGSVSVSNFPATQPISGTVAISNASVAVTGTFWQATQPVSIAATVAVSGPLTDTQLRALAVPVTADPITFASAQHVIVDSAALGTVTVGGSVSISNLPATQPVSGTVAISNASVAVTGTFWQATQPISGSVSFTAPQHIICDASSAVIGHTIVDSGAVTATLNAETTKVIGTVNIASAQTVGLVAGSAVIGHVIVDTAPSTAVTNAGTFAVQATTTPAAPTTSGYSQAAITFNSSGDTTIVSGTVGQTIRVFRIFVVNSDATTATNLTVKDSTPTSFSGAFRLASGGSFNADGQGDPLYITASGKNVVLTSSAAVQMSGTVWYTKS